LKLSVIIVNYNVEYFLEQCLNSVIKAIENVDAEIFVVDNISVDGSVAMVQSKFPSVILIENKENVGFSKANNQAMRIAKGEYILLLNPDTVVEEDTFTKVCDFMDAHPNAGGLGVKMIDGKGNFLPESKRGLPTPAVAFYKIFGLSALFPKSKTFGKYHLGFLSKEEIHEIEILSGAFMLMRKSTLDKVGLLDEDFFMYGEDIDLSYRILKGGYKNYYFPNTSIIHYKGESTKKSSVNYVFVFYNAMIIFAKKHFSEKNAKTFSFLINLAIYLRAGIAIINRFIKQILFPIIDFSLSLSLMIFVGILYENNSGVNFDDYVFKFALPIYSFIWIICLYMLGGYDKPLKILKTIKGVFVGSGIILIIYALLSKDYQFSRAFVFLASFSVLLTALFTRFVTNFFKIGGYTFMNVAKRNFVIVGDHEESERIKPLLKQTVTLAHYATISPSENKTDQHYQGTINQLADYIHINKIDEVIFCAKNLSSQQIIATMSSVKTSNKVDFKIAQPDSLYLIGSNSIHTAGDLYLLDLNTIATTENKRNKRLFDFFLALILLLTFPLNFWFVKRKIAYLGNILVVLIGKKTWIGFDSKISQIGLPKIKKSIIPVAGQQQSVEFVKKQQIIYAKDYSTSIDLKIVVQHFSELGNK
jgi:O-antigen biosynthesis protein